MTSFNKFRDTYNSVAIHLRTTPCIDTENSVRDVKAALEERFEQLREILASWPDEANWPAIEADAVVSDIESRKRLNANVEAGRRAGVWA